MQLAYSDGIKLHGKRLKEKYGFEDYIDDRKPTLFYGMFFGRDWRLCLAHRGKRAAMWSGSDILGKERLKLLTSQKDILHVATGNYIENDLKPYTDNYIVVPKINTPVEIWEPKPLGNLIYWCNSDDPKYGAEYKERLVKEFGEYKFLFTDCYGENKRTYELVGMKYAYEKCFMGLRLTKRDGCPNTVMEMGLMGRYVVSNYDAPNTLGWDNIDHIIKCIKMYENKDSYKFIAGLMKDFLSLNLIEEIENKWKGSQG